MKYTLLLILLLILSCRNQKKEILLADREAPLGWIYLNMYDDKSFEFISSGLIRGDDKYPGTYELKNDTVYFTYDGSTPQAGSKAIIANGFVNYFGGKYPERIEIKLNKLLINK
ncbi:hypothetical protein [Chryseobacterium hispalense]|uniref:hypothetical protein n=1 Tax=Chryseobacterium hispalense TaxID=1453492 RepID=UPI0004937F41|nr:hypothetical protein [Chryseobacterium hispalense]